MPCPIVSGGGTGTYDTTGQIDGVDEVQAGSYALMDCHYRTLRPEFRCAMTVLSTVISTAGGKVVTDVGLKGMGNDFGPPVVKDTPNATVLSIAEEHTSIGNLPAHVGDRIRLIPSHGCTTSNLHRRMWVVRKDAVADVWPIEGSGRLE
jgi:D-serine deaminase-like pyridoxal phosphate-dependent protein